MFIVSNGGIYTKHDTSFVMNRPRGFESHVLLITRSKAVFRFRDEEHRADPQQAVLIKPHVPYSYYNPSGTYTDDWLHFSGDENDLAAIDPSAFHRPFMVGDPSFSSFYIKQLLYENSYAPEEIRAETIDSMFKVMLAHLMYDLHHSSISVYSPYLHPLQQLRLDMRSAPWHALSASEAAAEIGISLSYFQHLYSELFGISYQKDLIKMRLSYSEELLRGTDLSIDEIAIACGYSNPVHFYRQFREMYGITPGQYRR